MRPNTGMRHYVTEERWTPGSYRIECACGQHAEAKADGTGESMFGLLRREAHALLIEQHQAEGLLK